MARLKPQTHQIQDDRRRLADCAFAGCGKESLVRVREFENSWVNLCSDHYAKWFTPDRMERKHPTKNVVCESIRQAARGVSGNIGRHLQK